ncbi:MAG: enolase C-terminal domain-like protein [Thermomicrobiales bacterium]
MALAKRVEEFNVYWFESRSRRMIAMTGTARWRAATSIPIATGENEYTRYGFRDLIEHDAASILNADAKILGGVTEFMKVAALAQAISISISRRTVRRISISTWWRRSRTGRS